MKPLLFFAFLLVFGNLFLACSEDPPGGSFSKSGEILDDAEEETGEYELVWSEEFNAAENSLPDPAEWWLEKGGDGWGNNELQYYLETGHFDGDTVALVSNGTLKIRAIKRDYQGNQYISARMNTSQSWLYGKFEARLKVPGGKGGWPAFWMLPENFNSWPLDGEIDIMEYVGYDKGVVHGSVHTESYNHKIGTQKTATKTVTTAESEFHVYAMEWTSKKVQVFVDGKSYFTFYNDMKYNKKTWPFNAPFYLKLNLAVGGWGGQQGIDDSIFPQVFEVDYIRVYQKK